MNKYLPGQPMDILLTKEAWFSIGLSHGDMSYPMVAIVTLLEKERGIDYRYLDVYWGSSKDGWYDIRRADLPDSWQTTDGKYDND